MTRSTSAAVALTLALSVGLLIAALDTHASEVQVAVLLLLVTGAMLGALAPPVAPYAGLLLGAGVALTFIWMQARGLPTQSNGFAGTLLALIPAILGALAGAMLRRRRAANPGLAKRTWQ